MWEIAGVIISIIGVIVAIVTYYVQKTTKKHKVRREIVDFIKSKVQTKQDISAQYIGTEAAVFCRKNRIKKIDIIEIIEDLISEYSSIKNKNTKQIVDKLISLRAEIAQMYWRKKQKTTICYDKNMYSIKHEIMANTGIVGNVYISTHGNRTNNDVQADIEIEKDNNLKNAIA